MIKAGRPAPAVPFNRRHDRKRFVALMRAKRGFALSRKKRGFTLVELLVVIAIIAILAAILTVAVGAAMRTVFSFTIQTEAKQLEQALTAYNSKYGSYPPCIGTVADSGTPSASAYYSAYFKRHIDTAFRNNREASGIYLTGSTTILGDSSSASGTLVNATIDRLDASESLPYFLGGAAQYSGNVLGLKKDPIKPLTGSAAGSAESFYDFAPEQLVDLDGDGFPSYIPKAADGSTPFLYFAGYAYKDLPAASTPPNRIALLQWPPDFGSAGDPGNYENWIAGSPPVPADNAPGGYDPGVARPYINGRPATPAWYNLDTYQLLSAGLDNAYGSDGVTDGATDALYPKDIDPPFTDYTNYKFLAPAGDPEAWVNMDPEDEDNLANFTEGQTFGEVGLE